MRIVNENCTFSAETNKDHLKNVQHANGNGMVNEAFEIEVCITFCCSKKEYTIIYIYFLKSMPLFS